MRPFNRKSTIFTHVSQILYVYPNKCIQNTKQQLGLNSSNRIKVEVKVAYLVMINKENEPSKKKTLLFGN